MEGDASVTIPHEHSDNFQDHTGRPDKHALDQNFKNDMPVLAVSGDCDGAR